MKTKFILLLSTAPLLHAGSPDPAVMLGGPSEYWIKPTLDIRARYEFADVDGYDPSHAFTVRERVGLKTQAWNGFSAFVEGEFSQAIVDDYNGSAPFAEPFDPANSNINDPETNELNQAYIQYSGFDTIAKGGRQRIIYDNAAIIGNVGWRQNEQTYDAVSLANTSLDGLTLNYAFIDQVNRVFGSDAGGFLENVPANVHLFNASYAGIKGLTLGGYAYLMGFEDVATWDNNTFGISAKGTLAGLALYGEIAFQEGSGPMEDDEAGYAHATVTKSFGSQSVTLGVEQLDAGFKTPLATVHVFNGFADVTDGGRIAGNHNGLTDVYASHTIPIFFGIKWMNALHAFGDNEISSGYGWEYDSVLTKKFDDHFTAIAKLAHFESEGDTYIGTPGASELPTTTRFSLELDYTF